MNILVINAGSSSLKYQFINSISHIGYVGKRTACPLLQHLLPVIHLLKEFKHHGDTSHCGVVDEHTTFGLTAALTLNYLLPPLQDRSFGKEVRHSVAILGQPIIGTFAARNLTTHNAHTQHLNKMGDIHSGLAQSSIILLIAPF